MTTITFEEIYLWNSFSQICCFSLFKGLEFHSGESTSGMTSEKERMHKKESKETERMKERKKERKKEKKRKKGRMHKNECRERK